MDCLDVYGSTSSAHQDMMADAVVAGCKVHGDPARRVARRMDLRDSKRVCMWGWRNGVLHYEKGQNILIMERGYIGNRYAWFSLGWNGLNARARMPIAKDNGARWQQHFAKFMAPWRPCDKQDRYALIMGQVPTDKSLNGMVFGNWLNRVASDMRHAGIRDILFRPHPLAPAMRCSLPVLGGTLQAAIAGASVVVTYNSNSGVDAVLAGVPAVTMDEGAMAYEVTSHNPCGQVFKPDRTAWAYNMAFAQWLPAEVASGVAWDALRKLV